MSDTELIASALRDLAAQADPVTPAADALWQAGQRHRQRGAMATAAAAAGAAAVATVLALTVGGPGTVRDSGHGRTSGAAAPIALSTPIRFEQVARVGRPPCPAAINPITGSVTGQPECIWFTGTGMAITRVESARVQQSVSGHYQLDIRLAPADARRFARLTRELAGQHSPRNRLAIVTNGHVLADPVVLTATTSGQAAIPGFANKPEAEFFLATLVGG
jgi:hypothetical protein